MVNVMLYYSEDLFLHRLLPQANCSYQKLYRCSGVHMEAYLVSSLPKDQIVSRCPSGWSESQPLFSKRPLNRQVLPLGTLVTSKTPDITAPPLIGDEKIGVLLLNLGGPETLDDVQPFLFNLFADPVSSGLAFLLVHLRIWFYELQLYPLVCIFEY